MFGKLNFRNSEKTISQLNILDLIHQLKSLKEVQFTPSDEGRNYVDWVVSIYNSSKFDEEDKILLPRFFEVLKKMYRCSQAWMEHTR